MNKLAVTLFVTAASAAVMYAQAPSMDLASEKAVRASMDQFAKAVLGKDKATLEKLMADSILYSHSNGNLDTKAQFIDNVMNEKPKYEGFDYSDQKVIIYGTTAVARGKITVKDFQNGQRRTLELNAMQIWLKGAKGWTMVARQSTRLNP